VKRVVSTLIAVMAVSLLVPLSANAVIQINRGIAGARLDNTKAQVRAALGNPVRIAAGRNEFGRFTEFRYRGRITVSFQSGNRVTAVTTRGLGDRTNRGVGVRSTLAAVQNRVPGVSCQSFPPLRLCQVGQGLPGQRVTTFFVRSGRVTRVTVGFVID
jgi:hypothetical protein